MVIRKDTVAVSCYCRYPSVGCQATHDGSVLCVIWNAALSEVMMYSSCSLSRPKRISGLSHLVGVVDACGSEAVVHWKLP